MMTHLGNHVEIYEAAMNVVIRGLQDEHTHLGNLTFIGYSVKETDVNYLVVYRPRLVRRLTRLENKLQIPEKQRHQCTRRLKEAQEVYLKGTRINKKSSQTVPDGTQQINAAYDHSNWWQSLPMSTRAPQVSRLGKYNMLSLY